MSGKALWPDCVMAGAVCDHAAVLSPAIPNVRAARFAYQTAPVPFRAGIRPALDSFARQVRDNGRDDLRAAKEKG